MMRVRFLSVSTTQARFRNHFSGAALLLILRDSIVDFIVSEGFTVTRS